MASEEPHENGTSTIVDTINQINWDGLRRLSLQPGGFGVRRQEIWPELLHAQWIRSESSLSLENPEDSDADPPTHQDERQIRLDTERSFVLYPVDQREDKERLQSELHELIVSVFRKRRKLHYFQGYHDIVTVLFLTLPREAQLPCAEKLSLHRVRDSMGLTLEPVLGLLRILKNLLRLEDSEFASMLERASPLPFYALPNILTLFAHDTPTLELIRHIFDFLLCRPPIIIVYLAAAVILSRKKEVELLEKQGEEGMVHSLLTGLPDLYDSEEDASPPTIDDKSRSSRSATDKEIKDEPAEENLQTEDVTRDLDLKSETTEQTVEETENADELLSQASTLVQDDLSVSRPFNDQFVANDDPTEHASELKVEPADDTTLDIPPPADSTVSDFNNGLSHQDETPTSPSEPPSPVLSDSDDLPSLRPPRTRRRPTSLVSFLAHAAEMYEAYPPTHPALNVSAILGPHSVVHTWHEDPLVLPTDDAAEQMVDHPEKVVLPYIEANDEEEGSDVEGSTPESSAWGYGRRQSKGKDQRSRKSKGKSKGRKLRKRTPLHLASMLVERRNVVAGAVLVLGIAVAVYGMRVNGGIGEVGAGVGGGATRLAEGRSEWRRLRGWLVSAGESILDGFQVGLGFGVL